MDKLRKFISIVNAWAPPILGLIIALIVFHGVLGVIDLSALWAAIGGFYFWVIVSAIGFWVVACFFPWVLIILAGTVVLLVVLLVVGLIGSIF